MVARYYESDLTDAEWELLSPLILDFLHGSYI